jgi:hypothetical protein
MDKDHCRVAITRKCAINNLAFFFGGLADELIDEIGWGIADY